MSSENTPLFSLLIALAARNEAVTLLPFEQYCTQGERLSFTLLAGGSDCVGAVPFAVAMMKAAALQRFDFAISLGFCGARDQSLEIGENVLLTHDTFFDYGLTRPSGFIPLSDTPFPTPHGDPSGWLLATSPSLLPFVSPALPHRRGYTLSHPEAEGDVSSFGRPFPHSSVETMEGAAFAYVAAELAIPSLAIRTVSNYCALGDSAQWNIPKAQRGVREAFAEAIKTVISYINWKKMKSNFLATLRWAFSPCPNDTFIFGPLATGLLLDDAPISPTLADIDELNAIALRGEADVIKVSAAAVPSFGPTYQVLPCGGAMGEGVGPLLVRREDDHTPISPSSRVAHPGRLTTAFALFRLFHPEVSQLQEMLFSDIEPAVRHGEVSHGLLIHEGRFTYQAHRLHAEEDLGRRWENEYRLPLPLGLILVRRSLPQTVKTAVREAISRSLCYAWANPQMVMPYVATHAQEMDEEVQQKHINLYVNRYSETIGTQGETALRTLWSAVAKDSQPAERDLFFRD